MCLAEITTPALKNENLNRLPSCALIFYWEGMLVSCACDVQCCVCWCAMHAWRVCVREGLPRFLMLPQSQAVQTTHTAT
jgi:hypothetical protein